MVFMMNIMIQGKEVRVVGRGCREVEEVGERKEWKGRKVKEVGKKGKRERKIDRQKEIEGDEIYRKISQRQ